MTTFLTGFICFIIGAIGGFGAGFLVYRNNANRLQGVEKQVKG